MFWYSLGVAREDKHAEQTPLTTSRLEINANDINMAAVAAMNAPRAYALA